MALETKETAERAVQVYGGLEPAWWVLCGLSPGKDDTMIFGDPKK